MAKSRVIAILLIGVCFGLFICGCDSYNEQTEASGGSQENKQRIRIAYVDLYREDIQKACKEFIQETMLDVILEMASTEAADLPQEIEELCEMVIKMAVYNKDPNVAGAEILAEVYKQEPQLTNKERGEFVSILADMIRDIENVLYSEPGIDDLFQLFSAAILQGFIMEGMLIEHVKYAWNEYDLSFQYSDALGYVGYEAKCVRQNVKRVEFDNISIFATNSMEEDSSFEAGPLCRDFHLIFKGGKLENLISFSDKNELSQRLIEFMKERSERETAQEKRNIQEELAFSDKNELADALNVLSETLSGTGKGKRENNAKTRAEQDQRKVRQNKRETVVDTGWRELARWQGSGMKNTETFHVSADTWRISWKTWSTEYSVPFLQIWVHNTDGSLPDVAANVLSEADTNSSVMRGSGDYYLVINTGLSYIVIVEEKI